MNELCKCVNAGFCTRHKVQKDELMYSACRGESPHLDCGYKYWRAWELGHLGATKQDDPQVDIKWKCNNRTIKTGPEHQRKRHTKRPSTYVGDCLAKRFSAMGFEPVEGCPCKKVQRRLNTVQPDEVIRNVNHWATIVKKSIKKWKEIKGGVWTVIPSPPLTLLCTYLIEAAEEAAELLKGTTACSGDTV